MNESSSPKEKPAELTEQSAAGRVGMLMEDNWDDQLPNRLRDLELTYNEHQYDVDIQMLRNLEGPREPLKTGMEQFDARQVGRLPFRPPSNFMDDVYTGRNDTIGFEDFMNLPKNKKQKKRKPHDVVGQFYDV